MEDCEYDKANEELVNLIGKWHENGIPAHEIVYLGLFNFFSLLKDCAPNKVEMLKLFSLSMGAVYDVHKESEELNKMTNLQEEIDKL